MQQVSLKKNMVMSALLTVSSLIFPLITFPYVSRILSPSGIGKVSFAISIISYFSLFAQLGIPTYGVRACAKVRDDREKLTRTVHELLVINIVMDCISYFALFLALLYVTKLQNEKTLYVVVSATILLTSIGMEWLYKALEQYSYITIRSVLFKFIALIFMLLLINEKKDFLLYGALSIFAASASNVLNLINAHKYVSFKPIWGYNFKRHFKPILIFFSMSCATTIYGNLDSIMLGFIKTDIDVGYYGAAVKVKSILVGLVTSLGIVLMPRASYFIEQGKRLEFNKITEKATKFVCVVSIPLFVYFAVFAKESILILSGNEFEGAIIPMAIIMPTLLLIGLSNIFGLQILVPIGKESVVLYSVFGGALSNLLFNAILIPYYGAVGAAIGTVIAEAIVLIIQCYFLKSELQRLFGTLQICHILLCTVISAICTIWFKFLPLNNFFIMCVSATIYFMLYIIGLIILKEPITLEIMEICKKKFNH